MIFGDSELVSSMISNFSTGQLVFEEAKLDIMYSIFGYYMKILAILTLLNDNGSDMSVEFGPH